MNLVEVAILYANKSTYHYKHDSNESIIPNLVESSRRRELAQILIFIAVLKTPMSLSSLSQKVLLIGQVSIDLERRSESVIET